MQQIQTWRPHIGYYPPGLGATPKLFSDKAWWAIGAGGHVMRMGLGDAAGDLQAFNLSVSAGDTYLNAGEFTNAISAYQAAGAAGASVVGPEIDVQTGGASKPLTQQAWAINGNLAAINGITSWDAQNAQGFARQMQNLYNQAITASAPPAATPGGSTIQPSAALTAAATALINRLTTGGCTQSSFPECLAFQQQYNSEGQITLTVDGKYGDESMAALQRVINTVQSPPSAVPASCFPSGGGGNTPPQRVPTVVIPAGGQTTDWTPWLIGAAALVGAGGIGYAVWHKHKKNRRR
jgi:hypothetical protein